MTNLPYTRFDNSSVVAASVEAHWFDQRATCYSRYRDHRYRVTSGGADLLTTRKAQDSSLLRLRRRPPGESWLSGWDPNYLGSGQRVYGIHHPGGHDKKYAAGITRPKASGPICEDPEDPDPDTCFYVEDAIPVYVNDGATEGGSSGSGLFRGEYLVGALSGGDPDDCSDAVYGRFGDFFPHVRRWLRPDLSRVGSVAVWPTSVEVLEGGERDYGLRLRLRPNFPVTITVRVSGDRSLRVDPPRVTFPLEDWASSQRITVHASEDGDQVDGSATIAHTVTSIDVAYHGIRIASVEATEKDNDRRAGTVTGVTARATDESGTLELRWNAVAGADAYIVEWRQPHQAFSRSRRRTVSAPATATTLTDLDVDAIFIVRVIATEADRRDANPSQTVSVTTKGELRRFWRGWRLWLPNAAETTPSSSRP